MKSVFADYLPLKYSWQGCFEYQCKTEGHHWNYFDKNKWGLLIGGRLGKHIRKSPSVKEVIDSFAFTIPTESTQPRISSPLLDWFLEKSMPAQPCKGALTMILNSVAKERTFKSFEVMSSFCDGHATINIRNLPNNTPCWFYLPNFNAEEYIAEFLLCLRENVIDDLRDNGEFRKFLDQLRFIRVLHKYSPIEVINSGKKSFRVLLRVDTCAVEYVRGRVCGCLPIPGPAPKLGHLETHKDEPAVVKSPEIIVVSPSVDNALVNLSQIWQDTFARAVLISAPSGSGKEELTKSIPYGNGRPIENLQTVSMADSDVISLQKRLYGQESSGVFLPGLIEFAKGSALFLDEVHQPEEKPEARANLLRTLEAGEYFAINSNRLQKVNDVLFLMATSKRLEELNELKPADFWTRMTHALEIRHPLDADDSQTKLHIISCFFNHFWWMRTEAFYGMKPVFTSPPEEIRIDPSRLVIFWQVHSMTKIMGFTCMSPDDPTLIPIEEEKKYLPLLFANVFDTCMNEHPEQTSQDFSIRGIRSMITRLFSIAASSVAHGQIPWELNGSFDEDARKTFKEISRIACLNHKGDSAEKQPPSLASDYHL